MAIQKTVLFVGVAALLLLGAPAAFHASASGATENTVANESWTPNAGTFTVLNNSRIAGATYNDTVVVKDENGTVVSAGSDYVWNDSVGEGTIKAVAGGELDGDASATIDYTYHEPTDENLTLRHSLGALYQALPFLIVALFVGLLLSGASIWS